LILRAVAWRPTSPALAIGTGALPDASVQAGYRPALTFVDGTSGIADPFSLIAAKLAAAIFIFDVAAPSPPSMCVDLACRVKALADSGAHDQ
jgi:hypothetical protein